MSRRIKIAIVGCGAVTRRHHLPVLLSDERVEISALCDTNISAASDVAKRFGINCRVYENYHDMLNSDIDVVDICTPGHLHYQQAETCLNAGKHVLVEKPPVLKATDAEKLIAMADSKGLKMGTIFNNRYRDVVQRLRTYCGSGVMGSIKKVYVIHHANVIYSDSPWLWDEKKTKPLVYELGIHFLDLVVDLLGEHEEIISVIPYYQESIGLTTEIQINARFKSGGTAMIIIAQDSTRHSTFKTEASVYGTGMDAYLRFFPPMVRLSSGMEHPLEILKTEIKCFGKVAYLLATRKWRAYQNRGHEVSIKKYIDWITHGNKYEFALDKVMPTLRFLDAIAERIPSYSGADGIP